MKLKLLLANLALLFLLSSCSKETADLPELNEAIDTTIEFRSPPKKQYAAITFRPHKGVYEGDFFTAEYLPHEQKIFIASQRRLLINLSTIAIVEQPDCGGIDGGYSCDDTYYYINVDEAFAQCLAGTQHAIFLEFYYYF